LNNFKRTNDDGEIIKLSSICGKVSINERINDMKRTTKF